MAVTLLSLNEFEFNRSYDKAGVQVIAETLSSTLNSVTTICAPVGCAAWAPALTVLERAAGVQYKKKSPFNREGPAVSRFSALDDLFRVGPPFGTDAAVPENVLAVVQLYAVPGGDLLQKSTQLLNTAQRTNPKILDGKMSVVFALMRADKSVDFTAVLNANAVKSYASYRDDYEANIDLLFAMDFSRAAAVFHNMGNGGSAGALALHADKFLGLVESGQVKHGMDYMVYDTIASCAGADPERLVPLVDRVYAGAIKTPRCDLALAKFLTNVGKGPQEGAAVNAAELLCKMLHEPTLSDNGPASVLSSLSNLSPLLGDENRGLLTPHMDAIKSHATKNSVLVEKVVDWYEGRSLAKTDARLDALEAKVAAMNDEFSSKCANFDDVVAMMDKKIADLKDFVGEIVKKLPQPCKLEVVGGVRKTLLLHFACSRTGQTVTTESKDWHQWCKVGFGLMKLGKCVAVAAAGNPMALAGGVGAIKDIYHGYKSKDDADFNQFISQPFLTSAESDKLILQLRSSKFFEKMDYDAQAGDWVLVSALTAEELEKRGQKKADVADTKANVTHKKGANFGLGSVKDGVSLVSEVAGMAQAEVTPDQVTEAQEVAAEYQDAAGAAAGVAGAAAGATKKRFTLFGSKSSSKSAPPPAPPPAKSPLSATSSTPPKAPSPSSSSASAPVSRTGSAAAAAVEGNGTALLQKRVVQLEAALKEQGEQQKLLQQKVAEQEQRLQVLEAAAAKSAAPSPGEAEAGQAHRIAILEVQLKRLLKQMSDSPANKASAESAGAI